MSYELNKHKLLTKKQANLLLQHVKEDIGLGSEGTFSRIDKNGERAFLAKEAEVVESALFRIEAYLIQD